MSSYRICLLDGGGTIMTAKTFNGADDNAAREFAVGRLGRKSRYDDFELWRGGRRVWQVGRENVGCSLGALRS
jgi:hypothetical protein